MGSTQTVFENDKERILSDEELTNLQTFLKDSIRETNAFIEFANSNIPEIDRDLHEPLIKNRTLLLAAQKLLDSDSQLVISSPRVNEILSQLDLGTLRLVHNDYNLEVLCNK